MTHESGRYGGQDPWAGDPGSTQGWGARPVDGGPPGQQAWPATGGWPAAGPGPSHPDQPYPPQPYPGQPYPGQAHPGLPYPAQQYPGQPYPAQQYAGQPFTGPPTHGQPVRGPMRPGGVTAAAVLAFVQSGLLLIAGLFVLAGADAVGVFDDSRLGLDDEFTVVALATWLATGLLIAGGAQVLNGRRGILLGGCALSLVISGYWLVRVVSDVPSRGILAWPFLFAVLPVISIVLAGTGAARHWSATRVMSRT